jgi:hypothetical protein
VEKDMKREERFWNVDLIVAFRNLVLVLREWLAQMETFLMMALTFIAIALPVLIPAFIMWYLAGFPRIPW